MFCAFIVMVFATCGKNTAVFENNMPEEKWAVIREYVVPNAPVSNERPLPNVLSEQEVLIKAADYVNENGLLDPSHYAFQTYPALMTAKIETPVLLTDTETGEPGCYTLMAVDDRGVYLAEAAFNPDVNASNTRFELGRGFAFPDSTDHYITKREAVDLIQSQFPGSTVSGPMAITNLRLEDDSHSHRVTFWYFTVNDNARNAAGDSDEYIIAVGIPGYTSIPGGVSNRAAIDFAGQRGNVHLNGYRMAKLNKPLRLFDKWNAVRTVGGASFAPSDYPTESVGFTPVPLK